MDKQKIERTDEAYVDDGASLFTEEKQDRVLERVQALFRESGMTLTELAGLACVSESAVTRYLSGKTKNPHFFTVCAIVLALGGDINAILRLPGEERAPEPDNPYREIIEIYRQDLAEKKERISTLERLMRKNLAVTIVTLALLALMLGCVIAVCIYDLQHPDRGWWQQVQGSIRGARGFFL